MFVLEIVFTILLAPTGAQEVTECLSVPVCVCQSVCDIVEFFHQYSNIHNCSDLQAAVSQLSLGSLLFLS